MLEIAVPGSEVLQIEYLVLDYNGTLACDGELIEGVAQSLRALAGNLQIHVVTADTFGKARSRLEGLPCELVVLPAENQDVGKLEYIERLGPGKTACVGNGRNDRLMLKEAVLGIAVVQEEGAATETLLAADVVCPDVLSALGLLTDPLRLKATLRS
ncbi:MAG: HAD family hydrolase [Planctomycetota bacterium]|jgi:soluble P-type ATPase